jgi:hypothetical protein
MSIERAAVADDLVEVCHSMGIRLFTRDSIQRGVLPM